MSQFFKTREETEVWLKEMGVENYTINEDLTVDVDGDVTLYKKNLASLPVTFGKVSKNFDCTYNQLTSLKGGPQSIGNDFICSENKLTSLENAPQSVGGDFYCSANQLASLVGSPIFVGGHFDCSDNQLVNLKGVPQSVGGDFYCPNNPYLGEYQKITSWNSIKSILLERKMQSDIAKSGSQKKKLKI